MIAIPIILAWLVLGWLGVVLFLRLDDAEADGFAIFMAVLFGPLNLLVGGLLFLLEHDWRRSGRLNRVFLVKR